jgi:hypothetical protein
MVLLGLTTSMLDLNTVFPALVTELTGSRVVFGLLYGVMLGARWCLTFFQPPSAVKTL